ncbi:hypothetical protein CW713_10535 [Methanophagales archaeon]|nr:hypothetical protein [Methanophagales archaeon]RJS77159.1 MAG: hypothetical protein CW713_10535 [Methanophagales archaeon]
MEKKRLVSPVVVSLLIIALIELVGMIGDPFRVESGGASIYWLFVETFILFLLPAAPIIYGWITRDRPGSILVGAIPIMGFILLLNFNYFYPSPDLKRIVEVVAYGVGLSAVAGLEGYFASKRIIPVAILLGIVWFFIFFTGID